MNLKNKVLKIKSFSDMLKILICSSCIIDIVFAVLSYLLGNYGIHFRQVVRTFMYLNNAIIVVAILGCVFIESPIEKGTSIGDIIVKSIAAILGVFILFIMFFVYVFFGANERPFYMEGKEFICSYEAGFDEDTATFYEPINMVIMKETKNNNRIYTHNSNLYSSDNFSFIKENNVDIIDDDFARLNPLAAKKQFKKGFRYIGNHSYDFGTIVIKFDNSESYVKEAQIKDDIFSYEGKSIKVIGKNIKSIKDEIEKIYNSTEVVIENPKNYRLEYKEGFTDNTKSIQISKTSYGDNKEYFSFSIDDKGIVSSMKFINESEDFN